MLNETITDNQINNTNTKKSSGLFSIINIPISFILEFFTLAGIGAKEIGLIMLDIIKYAYLTIRTFVIDPLNNAFVASSKTVDKTYQSTKKVIKKDEKKKSQLEVKFEKFWNNLSFVKNQKLALEQEKAKLAEELSGESAKRLTKPTIYRFKARDPKGKMIEDNFTGFSKLDVNTFLVNEGYDVFKIETSPWINFVYGESGFLSKKMKNKDLIFWLTQLSTYVKSGIPLTDSVRILANQMGNDAGRKRVFNMIVYELTMGESFSSALDKQGNMFPSLLINMIRAAEATGELEKTLEDMARYYTDIESTRKQMISAMTYPLVISIFAIVVVVFILVYIMPQFVGMYDSMGAEITGITKIVISLSKNLQENIVIYIIIAFLGTFAFITAYKQIKAFRRTVQVTLMRMPVIGKVMIYNELTVFTKTFSSLLKNSVFITDSIDILSKITNNEIYKEVMFDTINNIATGGKISDTFKDHWAIPNVAYYMIVTGESTGELADMLERVSKYYQEQHSSMVNSMKSLIEPVMIASLAVIVGFILLAVLMPMYGLYDTF